MKIVVGYSPIDSDKGVPLLSQNRQFQFFNAPTYIYPMVLASAATILSKEGHEVIWLDGIAEKWSYKQWEQKLIAADPDVFLMETKCPVIKYHWEMSKRVREVLPDMIQVWVGDHLSYLPQETFDNSFVDCIITGGDYDFLMVDFANHLGSKKELPAGFWFPENHPRIFSETAETFTTGKGKKLKTTGPAILNHNLDDLPFIDRDLTRWELYAYENGNYKYTPGTYVYSGRDCWWNKCTFCVWDHTLNPPGSYRSVSPERLFEEVKQLVDNYKVKEIFDDAGTMRVGKWLKKFCELMIESGYNKKVVFGCNMRFDGPDAELYKLMKKANFRFILYGIESANQSTLDRLEKGLTPEIIEKGAKICKEAGLEPHVTVMLGYPWETVEEAQNTINFTKKLFKKGYIDTLQATICIPYPGTPLYKECKENDWLLTENYEDFDMRKPVMKSEITSEQIMEMTQQLYKSFLSPAFIIRKIFGIRNFKDIKFLFMAGTRVIGHLVDFNPKQSKKK